MVDKGDTVFVGGGLHFDHLTKEAAHEIYNRFTLALSPSHPLTLSLSHYPYSEIEVTCRTDFQGIVGRICLLLPAAASAIKPFHRWRKDSWEAVKGLHHIREYNALVRDQICGGEREFVADLFALTLSTMSIDGTWACVRACVRVCGVQRFVMLCTGRSLTSNLFC